MSDRLVTWLGGKSMLISLVVAIAFFMENLDATIIVTALPQMASSFAVDTTRMSLGVTTYLMAAAACVTGSGWLADRFGCRTVFCTAMAVFTIASLGCGMAPNFTCFIIGRALQGAAAAMMSPVGRLVVLRTSEKKDLLKALSALIWPGLAAPVLGPPLGGFITDIASWHWIFYVNLPIGLIGMALVVIFVPNERKQPTPFDKAGFVLTALALIALTYGLDLLGLRSESTLILGFGLILGAALLGWLAIRTMRKAEHPLLKLDALRVRSFFVSSVTGGVIARAAISATPFLLPLMFQLAYGLSPFQSGSLLLIYMLANLAMKTVTNPILTRFGIRAVLVWNSLIAGAGIALCAFVAPDAPLLLNGVILAFAGAGRSMQLTAITMVNFADINPAQRQPASVFSSLTQQIGMGAGVAIGALLLTLSQSLRGENQLALTDFRVAFILAGALSGLSLLSFVTLDRSVGDEISGHKKPQQA